MSSTISCPACRRPLRVPESLLGQAVKCPSCAHTFTAPDHIEEEMPRPPSPSPEPSSRRSAPPPADHYDVEPPPSRRRTRDDDDYDDEPPPPRRRTRDDDDDYDDAPRRSRRRSRDERPGKMQAVSIMILIGGILATLHAVILMVTIYGLCWPGTYYSLVLGIMAIVKGSQLLGEKAHKQMPPSGIAIMQIINIVNCDWINLTLGIINLVFLNDEEVKDYFRG